MEIPPTGPVSSLRIDIGSGGADGWLNIWKFFIMKENNKLKKEWHEDNKNKTKNFLSVKLLIIHEDSEKSYQNEVYNHGHDYRHWRDTRENSGLWPKRF